MKKIIKKKIISKKKIVKTIKPIKKAKSSIIKKTEKKIKKIISKPTKRIVVIKKVLAKKNPKLNKKKIEIKNPKEISKKKNVKKEPKKLNNVLKVKNKPVIKKLDKKNSDDFAGEDLFKAKIKVIGVGGGGGSIVSEIGRSLEKATFVIADTDVRALKKKSGIKPFLFGQELTHGLGTGVNVDLAKQAAESAKEKISGFFKDQDIIIFVASLGGGLGSGATQVFAEAAKEFGGITFGIFTLPFKFEGKNKYRIAQNALRTLRQSLNVSLVIPNEKIFKIIDTSTPITNAFSTVNRSLMESLESLIDLIYNPGVINIDFADLRTILRGRGNSAFMNTIEESGKDRAEKTCENIFKNPLLQNNGFKAEKILFNIAGSDNLSMFEVEKISSHISSLNQDSKIIFGISKEPRLNNKIKTTILMTGGTPDLDKDEDLQILSENNLEKNEAIVPKKEEIKEKKVLTEKVKNEKKPKIENKKVIQSKTINKDIKIKKDKKVKLVNKKIDSVISEKSVPKNIKDDKLVPFVNEVKGPISVPVSVAEQKKAALKIIEEESSKKGIRRSGLEIKKAEELEEKKRIDQEKEWEIPAFLRKVKFKG